MAVSNAQELFNDKIPAALAANPAKAKEINAVFLFKIDGDGGGDWTVDLKGDQPSCEKGCCGTPNCIIEVAHSDFMIMLTHPAAAVQFHFTGRLKVGGDPMLATKLQKLFSLAG